MTLKDKLLVYVYNKSLLIEEDYKQLDLNTRYRKQDACDHLEHIIAITRMDAFNEFMQDLIILLKGSDPKK